jgi:hypothetical protein
LSLFKQFKEAGKAMKCNRQSEKCCKEAKYKIEVYKVRRVNKGRFVRYKRSGKPSKLFLCEDHVAHFNEDKVNYEILELKN